MKNNIIIALLIAGVGITVAIMATGGSQQAATTTITDNNGIEVTLYKSPTCGCCGGWGAHMEEKGYAVNVIETNDMQSVKEEFEIPYELESCHTSEIEGYVVEGHVPEEAIARLLSEKPDIKGIGMAGMPSGSPGMPGPKEDFEVYTINHDGTKGDLFVTL